MNVITKAVDCATVLTEPQARGIKAAGYGAACRYLGSWSKSMTPDEVAILKSSGLNIISIWEGDPTKASYFTLQQGISDGGKAVQSAIANGQPTGTAIYFTVDYDAAVQDLQAIQTYFNGVLQALGQYELGAYGDALVLEALRRAGVPVKYWWQTSGMSNGDQFGAANMYQHQYDLAVAGGVQVDVNDVYSNPGWWGQGGDIVLQLGSSGEDVKQLQTNLNKILGINLTVDGQFGPATQAAVKSFQQIHGLTVDGIVGPATASEIQKLLPPTPQPTPAPQPSQPTAQDIADAVSLLNQAQNKLKGGN